MRKTIVKGEEPTSSSSGRVCYVCLKRVDLNELGFRPHTHLSCRPGSAKWLAYFDALPAAKHTPEGKLIAEHYRRKNTQAKERLEEWKQRKADDDTGTKNVD